MKRFLMVLIAMLLIISCVAGRRNECPSKSITIYTTLEDGSIAMEILRVGEIEGEVVMPRVMSKVECEELIKERALQF